MMNWILKHLRLLIVVVTVAVTAIIVSAVMISSYVSYKNYEKTYYANDLEVRSATAAAPKMVEINNNFKSKYKKTYTADAADYTDNGNINLPLYLDAKSFADIEIVFNNDATDNLLENMNIKVNGSLVEEDGIKLEEAGEYHLVMENFALPEGDLTVLIEGVKNKTMPEIQKVTVFANANLSLREAA